MNRTDLVHVEGLVNDRWPICMEAGASLAGWSQQEIFDGELAWGDDYEFSDGGFWVITCRECIELVHA